MLEFIFSLRCSKLEHHKEHVKGGILMYLWFWSSTPLSIWEQ